MAAPSVWRVEFQQVEQLSIDEQVREARATIARGFLNNLETRRGVYS
jgi:hypothetical protein